MNCNIVKDLIPLYIDGCCSEESKMAVTEHIRNCDGCKKLLEDMKRPYDTVSVQKAPVTFRKLNDWKASVLQSVLLFLSFGLITVGVALEAKTPSGLMNGFWAVNLIIPATGFMLSLANWYFVKVYKHRKRFSNVSLLATLMITLSAYLWSVFHYELNLVDLYGSLHFSGIGLMLTAVFCALSKVLSNRYAMMLGKE